MANEVNLKDLLGGSVSFTENGEHRFVVGEAPIGIKFSGDVSVSNATLRGLANFVVARKESILDRKFESHFKVSTRSKTITLYVGERGSRKLLGDMDNVPSYTINAGAKLSDDYQDVKRLMGQNHPKAHDLAMHLRQKEHLFESKEEWARVVGKLRSAVTKVETIRKDTSDDSGARAKGFEAVVKDGALDLKWNWKISIVEDAEPELVEVEAIWEVQENGVELHVVLLNGGIVAQERAAIKRVFDQAVVSLTAVLGQDEVPFMYVD
jgi:hypothetical protein